MRRLFGVAYIKFNVIGAFQGKEIGECVRLQALGYILGHGEGRGLRE